MSAPDYSPFSASSSRSVHNWLCEPCHCPAFSSECSTCSDRSSSRSPSPVSWPESPLFQFPTSSVRDEPQRAFHPPYNPLAILADCAVAQPRQGASAMYPLHYVREVVPGVLEDGTLTVGHPWVDRYLNHLTSAYNEVTGQLAPGTSTQPPRKDMKGCVKLGRVQDVSAVLKVGVELDELQSECILALAALKTFSNPHHPAHFALWGKSVQDRTAAVVYKVYYHQPRLIESPVCWIGTQGLVWRLRHQQMMAFPPEAKEKSAGRNLRKRKVTDKAQAAGQALTSAAAPPSAPTDKGKGIDRGKAGAAPSWKRARTNETLQVHDENRIQTRALKAMKGATAPAEALTKETKLERMALPALDGVVPVLSSADVEMGEEVTVVQVAPTEAPITIAPPTRRSPRQTQKQAAPIPAPSVSTPAAGTSTSSSGTTTPATIHILSRPRPAMKGRNVSMATARSSTAVSEAASSEKTVVESDVKAKRGRKRKVAQMKEEDAAEDGPQVGAEAEAEQPRRKSARASTKTAKAAEAAAEMLPAAPKKVPVRRNTGGSHRKRRA